MILTNSHKLLLAALAFIPLLSVQPVRAQTESVTNATAAIADPAYESSYDRYMRLGYAAYKEQDYQSATFYFHTALQEIANDRDATIAFWNAQNGLKQQGTPLESPYDRYMDMGYNATEQSDYAMALEYFKKALSERPNNYYAVQAIRNVNTYLNRGTEATTTGDLSTSSDFYLGELAYDRYMRLGYAAQQRKDYRTALTYFRSALYDRPDDREATIAFWNAWDTIQGGTQDRFVGEGELDYDRYMRLGYEATNQKNYQQALEFFARALEQRPNDYYASQAIRNVNTYINRVETISQQ